MSLSSASWAHACSPSATEPVETVNRRLGESTLHMARRNNWLFTLSARRVSMPKRPRNDQRDTSKQPDQHKLTFCVFKMLNHTTQHSIAQHQLLLFELWESGKTTPNTSTSTCNPIQRMNHKLDLQKAQSPNTLVLKISLSLADKHGT